MCSDKIHSGSFNDILLSRSAKAEILNLNLYGRLVRRPDILPVAIVLV